MAAAKKTAGAETSPLRPVEVQGDTINVDDSKVNTWKTFELSAVISDDGANPHAKMQALFDLIEYVTDTDKQAIVDRFGGDGAAPTDVLAYAAELSQKIISKN